MYQIITAKYLTPLTRQNYTKPGKANRLGRLAQAIRDGAALTEQAFGGLVIHLNPGSDQPPAYGTDALAAALVGLRGVAAIRPRMHLSDVLMPIFDELGINL
ncbi:MAG: hypothetical protein GY943_11875, partial [Chloroflexi bacterium]|nr:hypothetical protein [Chloroflexota bacterium]